MKYPIIVINDDFHFQRYAHGWELHEYSDGVSKKAETKGEPIRVKRVTYHIDLEHICKEVIDRSVGEVESLADMPILLKNAVYELTGSLESRI